MSQWTGQFTGLLTRLPTTGRFSKKLFPGKTFSYFGASWLIGKPWFSAEPKSFFRTCTPISQVSGWEVDSEAGGKVFFCARSAPGKIHFSGSKSSKTAGKLTSEPQNGVQKRPGRLMVILRNSWDELIEKDFSWFSADPEKSFFTSQEFDWFCLKKSFLESLFLLSRTLIDNRKDFLLKRPVLGIP